jgi:hypothetical protein
VVESVAANEPVPLPVTSPESVIVWSPVFVPLLVPLNVPLCVASDPSPETSAAAIVTAPVRPATEVTAADTVPLETDSPVPTITPPSVEVVAFGSV